MKNIVIIGAGNVATHLSIALKNAGHSIAQIYSRDISKAECIAPLVDAESIDDLSAIAINADLYLISVSDSAICEIVEKMPVVEGVVAHTAGSVDVSVLNKFPLNGVFYPFQTFTKDKELDFSHVPILIEGNISHSRKIIHEVAESISDNVQKASGDKRRALHVSAVFACNFVNHLYALADDVLTKHGLDFDLLSPLIKETTQKALSMNPAHAQTGPARRNDKKVIQRHLDSLESGAFHHEIYALLSDSIIKKYEDGTDSFSS